MIWNIIAYLWIRVQTRSEWPWIAYNISIYSICQWMCRTKITEWIIETAISTVHPENTLRDDISQMNHQPSNEKCQLGNEKLSPPLFTYWLALCGWPWWEQHTAFQWHDLTWWKKSCHCESGRRVWHWNRWRWRDLNTNKTNLLLVPQYEIIH